MRIGLSQFSSPRDIAASVRGHAREAEAAADRGCALVLFPELSLTGYEPTVAARCAVSPDDAVFDPLSRLSAERSIAIAVGAPLRAEGGVEIGLVVFCPDGSRMDYAKQLLHADEGPYFVAGERTCDVAVGGHVVAPGICYEAVQPPHGEAAVERGATLYAVSVAKHADGMAAARGYLGGFAERRGVPVVVVNAVGRNDGFVSSGGSAAWRGDGGLVGELGADEGLLVVDV